MEAHGEALNRFLVEMFHEILNIEETALADAGGGLSLRELHLIEAVCRAVDAGADNRATAIAAAQRVTAGTLTTSVSLLEKKGYLERRRDERDRRAVRIYPTDRARRAEERHARFHREMVDGILGALDGEEAGVFVRALGSVAGFFRDKYERKGKENNRYDTDHH